MPVVFQPGERPPQPLDPDATVYTTPQKVADLLQIQYPDADLLATNASAGNTYVEIAPSDLRHTGYEAGDEIEILGDATLGEIAFIGSITLSGGNARLNLVDSATGVVGVDNYTLASTHNTADAATVQNLNSFTNGKRRGVTKSAVQHLIRRAQDKIDNLTNNAWRPMLQTAEYKNFDTYKPYRRRYYTDYVGSTPLLFRNAQQIIRLEIWQGQEYREIAAAECKIEILDNSVLDTTDYLYLCPGDGGVASLRVGTAKGEWRADFDNESTASNLSDLINKDGRRNKTGVPFSPSFSLETNSEVSGLQVANVHHEFLSSANADYGGGKLKVTSMRRGDGGENATLATTNENGIAISGCTSLTTTTTGAIGGGSLALTDAGSFANYGIIYTGTGASMVAARYTGKTGNTLTGVTDLAPAGFTAAMSGAGTVVNQHRMLIDYVGTTTGDEARLRDWWCDYELGVIYFNNTYPYFQWNSIKVSYIYGERYVEKAIEDICTKLVAMDLLLSDDRSVLFPEGTQNIDLGSKYQLLKTEVAETLPRYVELMTPWE
tara:strand:- start:6349 stop:7992 length:1644 start_codon:yes stop_codon:yes gene_type:complete